MDHSTETHRQVADHYAKAVTREKQGCCGTARQKGVAAQVAGYRADELDALPPDAVENSFGCGNPVAFADVRAGETVLDLGSGAGIDLLLAAQKVGSSGHVIGIDMTDEMIVKARRNIAQAGLENVEVRKGLIEDLPVDDGCVDWVISNCVINLSPDKSQVFAEIARVLKPGGRLSVSDIVVEQLPESFRQDPELHSACVAGAISERSYIDGLTAAGLTDVAVVDRLVYDSAQIAALVRSDVSSLAAGLSDIAKEIEGKVWSARFFARKPGL